MQQQKLSRVEELILEHQQAAREYSDAWDQRARALHEWGMLESNPETRRRFPDRAERNKLPDIAKALNILRVANEKFEIAGQRMVALDLAVSEARRQIGWQQRFRAAAKPAVAP